MVYTHTMNTLGKQAEDRALFFLQQQGLVLIERNWWCPSRRNRLSDAGRPYVGNGRGTLPEKSSVWGSDNEFDRYKMP